jgi:hypothetical protein
MTDTLLSFRRARPDDVPAIVRMMADDPLGATRERPGMPLPESYVQAFRAIERDANNELVAACQRDEVVGVLQLTLIPYLTYQASHEGMKLHFRPS